MLHRERLKSYDVFKGGFLTVVTQSDKALRFVALHEREGAFVIPNPWDRGSARLLEGLGFEALATTSSGFAQALGRLDGNVTLAEKIEHCAALCSVTNVPVTADLENGFDDDPAAVADAVLRVAEAGVVGASIEDYSGDMSNPIYEIAHAVDRIAAVVEAVATFDYPFTVTARAENMLRGRDDLDDTIRRLQAFEAAGADVLYAPGLTTLQQVRYVTSAVSKPVNVLVPFLPGTSVAELAQAGAKRLSIGGALANVVVGSVLKAGNEMLERGTFGWTSEMAARGEVARLFAPR